MIRPRHLLIAPVLGALASASVAAQDPPRVGLTIGYPASIGLLWHVSDRVAVRPDFAFSWTSSDSPSASSLGLSPSSNSLTRNTIGISGLIYVAQWDALRTYIAPRFGYSRSTSTTQGTVTSFVSVGAVGTGISLTPPPSITEVTTNYTTTTNGSTYEASGSLGAEYTLGKRFGVFAEVGLAFTHMPSPSISSDRTPALPTLDLGGSKGAGIRSGIGAILYF